MDRTEPAVQRPALVLGVLSASILLDALDLSITQVALPSIQRELALPAATLQWVATGYALRATGLLFAGKLDTLNKDFHPKSAKEELKEELDDLAQRQATEGDKP